MSVKKDTAHSVFQRLLHHAKERNEDFNLLLVRYGVERFLYRIGISQYRDNFVLKGASLFIIWKGYNYRVTRDIDLLASNAPEDLDSISEIFRKLCSFTTIDTDGMQFDPASIKTEEIREEKQYTGIRIKLLGFLKQARVPMQIDIGFGDAVTPPPEEIQYPVILPDSLQPWLKAYPRYTFVAEKIEAMVHLGLVNSRMKDFF